MSQLTKFARIFRNIRISKGLSLARLSKESGVNTSTLLRTEKGVTRPRLKTYMKIMNVLTKY